MRARTSRTQCGQEGSALFTVMLLVLVIGTLLGITFKASMQNVFSARKLADRVRALAIAEAGAHKAYSILQTNFAARLSDSAFPATAYGGGTYNVTVTPVSNNVAVVESFGQFSGAAETVILDVMNYGGDTPGGPPAGSAWENTIYANGRAVINGNGDIDGSIHGNVQVRFNGNLEITPGPIQATSATDIRVNGNVLTPGSLTAPTITITGNNDSGAAVNRVPFAAIPFPALDLTPYYNTAVANGQVKATGTYHSDVNWNNVPGGVIWIPGSVRFKGNFNCNAIVIATGAVRMDGNANWDAAGTDAGSIISRDSTITISGNVECDALLHAPGNITLSGNVRLNGQIISGSDVTINGNVEVINYAYSNPSAGNDGTSQDIIGISAWQR